MSKTQRRPPTPEICPICGEDVPPRALACPECGACHQSGWKEGALNEAELPDPDSDYDEFVKSEFGPPTPSIHPIWWVTAVIVLLALGLALLK